MEDIFKKLDEVVTPFMDYLDEMIKSRNYESELDDLEIEEFDPSQIFDL